MNVLSTKWVFKVKELGSDDGSVEQIPKAGLIARGFQQIEGGDFEETFAAGVKCASIRVLLLAASHFNLELYQVDVVMAFLQEDLAKVVFIVVPDGVTGGD